MGELTAAAPRVLVGRARAAYVGPALALAPHRNAVATVAVGLERSFALAFPGDGGANAERRCVAFVPAGRLHHLVADGPMVFVYLDVLADRGASGRLGRSAQDDRARLGADRRSTGGRLERSRAGIADAVREIVARDAGAVDDGPERRLARLFAALGLPARAPTPGSAVERTVRAIEREPAAFPSVARAAESAGLSVSRFQHVFGEVTGTTFRRYRLWRRMALVAEALADGATLTDAAVEAGFASPSHLSAAFRTMFGTSASALMAAGTRFEVERLERATSARA